MVLLWGLLFVFIFCISVKLSRGWIYEGNLCGTYCVSLNLELILGFCVTVAYL